MSSKTQTPKEIFQVFLSNSLDEIFVCKPIGNIFDSENICVEGKSMNEVIMNIEDKWGILCDKGNLIELFCIDQLRSGEIITVSGFILRIKLNKEVSELLEEKSHCEFVFYRDLIDIANHYHLKSNLKESMLNLVNVMNNKE